jgi:cobalt/nickel transport system ATP-binding protein
MTMFSQNITPQAPSVTANSNVLSISRLSFAYAEQPDILQNFSLTVNQGDRIGIIGHNGCGKTTLFLLICGVLTPAQGSIILLDRPVKSGEFRPEIGLVFQNPNDQLFSPSVWDDVAFAPQNMGLTPQEVEQRVSEVMELTGIEALADRPPHHLSGGEKRMVAIAGILAMQPQVMLYDEPTANLDLRARRRLIQFLQGSPQTLLISSHDLEFLLEVCDRIILLDDGCVIADGKPREVMGNEALMIEHGLEKPHSLMPHNDLHH